MNLKSFYVSIFLLILLLVTTSCSSPVNSPTHQAPQEVSRYQRKEWRHWSDFDGDCQKQRDEILIERSLAPVKYGKRNCKVKSGKWEDYYYPEVHTSSSAVDMDHLVPLKHAHQHGGASWPGDQKEKFANDPENLVITNKKYNRSKGAKSIAEWLPVNIQYACKYVKDWMKVKSKYSLYITPQEIDTHKRVLASCPQ